MRDEEQGPMGSITDERPRYANIDEWVFDAVGDDGAYRLYALLSMSVFGNAGFKLSRQYLAQRCGCSVDTIDRRIRALVAANVLRVESTSFNGGSGWNNYVLLDRPGSRIRAARGAADVRRREPRGRGTQEEKEITSKKKNPPTPSGGAPRNRNTARCNDCGKIGFVGTEVRRFVDSTAPYGKRTQYLHEGCKPRVQYGVQERISTSDKDEDWL